ncbi:MAG: XkdW family protein, partial [Pseudomonadota bacterium]|nr:XkdW family protein [Pseudomonadota bacterium]
MTEYPSRAIRLARFVRREPLVHFVVLAGIIFGADAILHPPDRNARVIVVTRAMRETMSANFDEDRERKATPAELNSMIENWVASEILYREGKLLGVDRGDDTIRDRIAFKLQLMIFSQLEAPNPTGAELRTWFEQNRDRFDEPERLSFYIGAPSDEVTARRNLKAIETNE